MEYLKNFVRVEKSNPNIWKRAPFDYLKPTFEILKILPENELEEMIQILEDWLNIDDSELFNFEDKAFNDFMDYIEKEFVKKDFYRFKY